MDGISGVLRILGYASYKANLGSLACTAGKALLEGQFRILSLFQFIKS
jgi:hypothetical protein